MTLNFVCMIAIMDVLENCNESINGNDNDLIALEMLGRAIIASAYHNPISANPGPMTEGPTRKERGRELAGARQNPTA